jgi:uncharacterized protein with HEPN domain
MRNDSLRLQDILDAIEAIRRHTPATREEFDAAEPVRSHILLNVQIIGEAVSKLSAKLKDENPLVPWKSIVKMRTIIAHVYFGIDWDEVWQVAVNDLRILKPQIESILATVEGENPA